MRNPRLFVGVATFGLLAAFAMHGYARAADLPSRKAAPAIPAALVDAWSGPYIGIGIGYGLMANPVWGAEAYSTGQQVPPGSTVLKPVYAPFAWTSGANVTTNASGPLGAALAGWNFKFGNFVAGVEGTYGLPIAASKTATFPATIGLGNIPSVAQLGTSYDYAATIGPRIGYLITPSMLIFGQGGLSLVGTGAGITSGAPWAIAGGQGVKHELFAGFFVGAGAEYQFAPGWRVGVDYKFVDVGHRTASMSGLLYGNAFPVWGTSATSYIAQGNTNTHVVTVSLRKSLDFLMAPTSLFAPTGNIGADASTAFSDAQAWNSATVSKIQSDIANLQSNVVKIQSNVAAGK
jgi:outer membrane immunogenic protein